jgi:nucleoside-diphosphate-sugar epimerase
MHVLVTGGTGFIGAHTVQALVAAGHSVRLLVRSPERIEQVLHPLGVNIDDYVVGDMRDEESVGRALDGCDAVFHAAAEVSVERRRSASVLASNPRGTEVVIDAAIAQGCDPIIHVSSVAALWRPGIPLIHANLPPAAAGAAYGQSKSLAEEHVRKRQAEGAPIVITYPAAVWGPPAGTSMGESIKALTHYARAGAMLSAGALSIIDVRDLGLIHAAAMQPGRGPRRYMCGGHFVQMPAYARVLREITRRRFPVVPIPGAGLRAIGYGFDAAMHVLPVDLVLTHEGMNLLTLWVPTDDRGIHEDLGIELRDLRETTRAALTGLVALGQLKPRHAGAALTAPDN